MSSILYPVFALLNLNHKDDQRSKTRISDLPNQKLVEFKMYMANICRVNISNPLHKLPDGLPHLMQHYWHKTVLWLQHKMTCKTGICFILTSFHLEISCFSLWYLLHCTLLTISGIPQRGAFEKHLGLRDLQNLYFSASSVSPLRNSWHFLTLISEFVAMIRVPSGIASDAEGCSWPTRLSGFQCSSEPADLLWMWK